LFPKRGSFAERDALETQSPKDAFAGPAYNLFIDPIHLAFILLSRL